MADVTPPDAHACGLRLNDDAHACGLRLDDDAHACGLRLNEDAHASGLRLNDRRYVFSDNALLRPDQGLVHPR